MSDTINYVLNDPTTPNLVIPVELPHAPAILNFKIDGFRGATDTMYTVEHQAAMCHYRMVFAINLINSYLKEPLTHWSQVQSLYVQPRAGKQLNAFYDRQALRFFYAMDPIRKSMVYAVNSTDVFMHELGHAFLDALRPDLFNVQAYEIWGFHESFGDINALINFLHNDFALEFLVNEINGNLFQDNTMSKLAEEMGLAIYDLTGGKQGHTAGFLRNAFNNFVYQQPESLARAGADNQITSEPHSFSRIFTGTWYEILCKMYDAEKAVVKDSKQALINARNILTSYTYNAIKNAPAGIRFYDAFAKAMLVQDKLNNYKYNGLMNEVFMKRNILRQPVKPMVDMSWEMYKSMIEPTDQVIEHENVSVVLTKNVELLTLPEFMVNVEAPNDNYLEFDKTGYCVDTSTTSPLELVDHVRNCVGFLHEKGLIRADRSTPFEITPEGNLVRSHFAGCFLANCTNPTQPEFLKCWKPENNSGCSCASKKRPGCNENRTVVRNTNIRLHVNGCGCSSISSTCGTKLSPKNGSKITPNC
jgi:hypothetical protein